MLSPKNVWKKPNVWKAFHFHKQPKKKIYIYIQHTIKKKQTWIRSNWLYSTKQLCFFFFIVSGQIINLKLQRCLRRKKTTTKMLCLMIKAKVKWCNGCLHIKLPKHHKTLFDHLLYFGSSKHSSSWPQTFLFMPARC